MIFVTKQDAINRISTALCDAAQQKTLLLMSGGSSAPISVAALKMLNETAQQNVTVILTDERYVAYDSINSNAKVLKDLDVTENCAKFIEILSSSNDSADLVTDQFGQNLSLQLQEVRNVVAVFGSGTNNHIAGIFPKSLSAKTYERPVICYRAPDFERITITPAVFSKINTAFMYDEGIIKDAAIHSIEQNYDSAKYPSQLLKKCDSWEILFNKGEV